MSEFEAGQTFEVRYPFVLRLVSLPPDDPEGMGFCEVVSWSPGMEFRASGPEDVEGYAHGEGAMLLCVVSTHKPAHYPERVFFTRRWRDPAGKVFGKPALRIATVEKFRRISKAYHHFYHVDPNEPIRDSLGREMEGAAS